MRIRQIWKNTALFLTSASLLILAAGCGNSNADSSPEAGSTEEIIEQGGIAPNYVAEGIELPEHFDYMIYPMEAIMVEQYSQDLSYYKDGDEADAFWFPMAVLSSLMAEEDGVEPEYDDDYFYYDKDQIDQFASTLFYDYARKTMPLAKVDETDFYVRYDEERGKYGLLSGNIGDLGIQVVNCLKEDDHYRLEAALINQETKNVISEYLLSIYQQKDAKATPFAYSIGSCEAMNRGEIDGLGTNQEFDEEVRVDENSDFVDEDEVMTATPMDDSDSGNEIIIEKKDALALAKTYMGEDYTYSYRGIVTIGEHDYYDFAIKEKTSKDVLVSTDGFDIVSGLHNKDGSWSFDQ